MITSLIPGSKMTAETVIAAKYPPHIDVTRAPLAFGDRAVPRLVSTV